MRKTLRALQYLGALALAGYAVHGSYHVYHGRPHDLLWACHLGAAVVGFGLIAKSPSANAVGTLMLCMGTPLWLLELAGGAVFYPTSLFTHVLGLVVGILGIGILGMPRGAWWKTAALLAMLIAVSRFTTPRAANVNVAFAIQSGWESYFSSHYLYLAVMLSTASVYFFAVERILHRAFRTPLAEETAS